MRINNMEEKPISRIDNNHILEKRNHLRPAFQPSHSVFVIFLFFFFWLLV